MAWKLGAVGALSVGILLGCCGAFQEGMNQGVAQQFTEMQGKLARVTDGPNKTALSALLDSGYLAANAGTIGLVDVSTFSVAFDEAVADGELSDVELQMLQQKYATLGQ